jgi:HD superfamily phosphohydrolase
MSNPFVFKLLGCDRIDFISRDAYFCGTLHLGTVAYSRIINESLIKTRTNIITGKEEEYLHFKRKVFSDIIQVVNARFFQYKSVYFHKTVEAASLILENIMSLCVKPLRLVERTEDLQEFVHLTDEAFLTEVSLSPLVPEEAKRLVKLLKLRKLPKLVLEREVPIDSIQLNPGENLEEASNRNLLDTLNDLGYTRQQVYIDRPIVIKAFEPKEFEKEHVYVSEGGRSWTFPEREAFDCQVKSIYNVAESPYVLQRVYRKPE